MHRGAFPSCAYCLLSLMLLVILYFFARLLSHMMALEALLVALQPCIIGTTASLDEVLSPLGSTISPQPPKPLLC